MRPRLWHGAALGLVAAGAGLAVSELASGFLHQRVSPVGAVGESVIRLTPGAVIERVISLVGHHDKTLLVAATLVGVLVLGAALGVLALRSLLAAQLAFGGLGALAMVAVNQRLTSSQTTLVPAFLGVAATLVVLAVLVGPARRSAAASAAAHVEGAGPAEATAATATRRSFLVGAGAVAAGALVVGLTGRVLARGRAAVEAARRALRLPITSPAPPAGVEVGVAGVAPWRTDQADFYRIDTALAIPQLTPSQWRLRVHGMVEHELDLGYQDLLDLGVEEGWLTLCCVSNEVGGDLISNAWFSGVPIARVLDRAGVAGDADAVLSTSQDGWTCGTPLGALTDGRDALFAIAMNGEPLTPEHGFPVRMVVPGLYGYVSATKWVVDVEVTRFADFTAFWTQRGWSPEGPVKTQSRIDVPGDGDTVQAGQVAVAGVAWAQHTGVEKVEVRVDDGPWEEARLGADPSTDTWRQWVHTWDATPGDHQVQVRATDASGATQTGERADVVPDGATGWHTIDVSVD